MTTIDHRPAQPVSENWDWQLLAACRGQDVEIFYHPYGERRREKKARITHAKQICQHCPVINECAAWALTTREPYGVWGGLSEDERADILGVRNLRYPYPAAATEPSIDLKVVAIAEPPTAHRRRADAIRASRGAGVP